MPQPVRTRRCYGPRRRHLPRDGVPCLGGVEQHGCQARAWVATEHTGGGAVQRLSTVPTPMAAGRAARARSTGRSPSRRGRQPAVRVSLASRRRPTPARSWRATWCVPAPRTNRQPRAADDGDADGVVRVRPERAERVVHHDWTAGDAALAKLVVQVVDIFRPVGAGQIEAADVDRPACESRLPRAPPSTAAPISPSAASSETAP